MATVTEVRTKPGRSIEITNVGPIEHVEATLEGRGGILIFRGRNGVGKTKALECVKTALSGKGSLEVRDGELRGHVDAFGVKIGVGKSTRRTGSLEVDTLEGRFDISALVDPGLKSPEAADAARIRALVQLFGIKPTPSMFYELLGGPEEYSKVVKLREITDDVVKMTGDIKRDIEAAARAEEAKAEAADGQATAFRQQFEQVDLTVESDATKLQAALQEATLAQNDLQNRAREIANQHKAMESARDAIEKAEAEYSGLSIEDAKADESKAEEARTESAAKVAEAEEALRQAQAALLAAKSRHESNISAHAAAVHIRKAAESHEATLAKWREQIGKPLDAPISQEQLTEAASVVNAAQSAVETGVKVRAALEAKAKFESAHETAKQHRTRADQLREAAKSADNVLTDLVMQSGCPLRIEEGRLVLATDRGNEYYAELSRGEATKIAIDAALPAVGEGGSIVMQQELYEGLDPQNRDEVDRHAEERGVWLVTAEATGDEQLLAEVYRRSEVTAA